MKLRPRCKHFWLIWDMHRLAFCPLAMFADVTMGQSPGTDLCNTDGRGLPFLQGCAEFGADHPESSVSCFPALRIARAGSVLISVRAPVGTMNYADQDYCIGRGLGAFKAKPGQSNTIFLKHAVDHNAGYLHRRSQGSTFAAVSTDDVRTVPIPAFSVEIQDKLAAVFVGIDTAIEKTEALIAKYQQIKAGLMHDLFTRGVLANGQLRPHREQAPELYQETAIGWIPKDWKIVPLTQISDVSRGKFTHRPRNDPAFFGGTHPFVQTGDVAASDGGVMYQHSQTLSERGTTVSQCFPEGTIAVTIAANIADTGILGISMFFPDSVVGVVVENSANNRFVEMCIRRAKPRLEALAPQSAQKNINLQDLRPLLIPLPQRIEQDLVADRYLWIQRKIDIEAATKAKFGLQKLGLMQDLLTGKVPVKASEPTTESAVA